MTMPAAPLEEMYRRINCRQGPFATREARAVIRDSWVARGAAGAAWLVDRLADEWHVDALEGVSSLLADIGAAAVPPILRALGGDPGVDRAEALLKALGWIEAPHDAGPVDGAEEVLGRYLVATAPDVRAAACGAVAILGADRAADLLRRRRGVESDRGVIEAIEDALAACDRGRPTP